MQYKLDGINSLPVPGLMKRKYKIAWALHIRCRHLDCSLSLYNHLKYEKSFVNVLKRHSKLCPRAEFTVSVEGFLFIRRRHHKKLTPVLAYNEMPKVKLQKIRKILGKALNTYEISGP